MLTNGLTTYRFTDHDVELQFEVVPGVMATFSPVGGFNPTAQNFKLGFDESTREFVGPVDARVTQGSPEDPDWPYAISGPDYDTVRSGALREAVVSEWIVDYRVPWAGPLQPLNKYWLSDIEFDNEVFRATAEGLVRFAQPKVGHTYGRSCRWHLGRDRHMAISLTRGCRFNVVGVTERGTVGTIIVARKTFVATGLSSSGNGYFELGRVLWVTGANQGYTSQVHRWLDTPNELTLIEDTPFDIETGDEFDVEPGCNGTSDHCITKFDNFINFGGQLTIPGNDFLLRVPRR